MSDELKSGIPVLIMAGLMALFLWRIYADNKELWNPKRKNDEKQQNDQKED